MIITAIEAVVTTGHVAIDGVTTDFVMIDFVTTDLVTTDGVATERATTGGVTIDRATRLKVVSTSDVTVIGRHALDSHHRTIHTERSVTAATVESDIGVTTGHVSDSVIIAGSDLDREHRKHVIIARSNSNRQLCNNSSSSAMSLNYKSALNNNHLL